MTRTDLCDRLLEATLPNVVFDGWSDHAVRQGAETVGVGPESVLQAFPNGAVDLIEHFSRWTDRKMVEAYGREDTSCLSLSQRVVLAVRLRLQQVDDYREAIRSALVWMAFPRYTFKATRLLYQTVDDIWYLVGDEATDFSFYTKRTMLAGVYGATLLYWLGDDTDHRAATWGFLERTLEATSGFGRKVSKVNDLSLGRLLQVVPSPVRLGRQLRKRAARVGIRKPFS